jgi:signal peptidase I
VLVDGTRYVLQEEYLDENSCTYGATAVQDGHSYVIPEGQYLVLGDNREHSIDSRYLGFVDRKAVLGRVAFLLWPIAKLGFVN